MKLTPVTDLLYPVAGPVHYLNRCTYCFQARDDIAVTVDPRDEELRRLCGRCYRSLRDGGRPDLATEDLAESWIWLARQFQNHRAGEETFVDEVVIDSALYRLTAWWGPTHDRWLAFEDLLEALLNLQAAEDPSAVLDCAMTGPDHDPETYVNDLRGLVDEAVHKLIGRA